VGTKTYDGVWFVAYTDDHPPPHVHGFYSGIEVILDLIDAEEETDREIHLSDRKKAIKPRNAKQAHVNHVIRVAEEHSDELFILWEDARS
jgi:Domain of unknown function (DUF4160)